MKQIILLPLFLVLVFIISKEVRLEAQERKTGFFVGVSPYASILPKLEKETSATLLRTTTTTTDIVASDVTNNDVLVDAVIFCNGNTPTGTFIASSFVSAADGTTTNALDCYAAVQALLGTSVDNLPAQKKEYSLSGAGLLFGYNFEKWRVSFSHYVYAAGDDKLTIQQIISDYFLGFGLYVGGGLGSMNLNYSIGSKSNTGFVLNFGYRYSIGKNIQLEAGYQHLAAEISVKKEQVISTTTSSTLRTYIGDVGAQKRAGGGSNGYNFNADGFRARIEADILSTIETVGDQEVKIKSPAALYINLKYSF